MNPVLRRLFWMMPTVLGVCFISFILMKAVPGDPVYGLIGEHADANAVEQYREKLGLNENIGLQWLRYMGLLLRGDLGVSYYTQVPVAQAIREKFPNTLLLAFTALGISLVGGVLFGFLGAKYRGGWVDRVLLFFITLAMSLPLFWLGLILVLVFAYYLQWLPPVGMGDWRHVLLPAVTLASRSLAGIARLVRSSLLEAMAEPHVLVARAKGLSAGAVMSRHAFRNITIPLVTLAGADFAGYLNGSVLTETIFGWDGLGRYAMTAIFRRDYPVLLGTVFFGAMVFVAMNFLVDLSYALLDPRLRKNKQL